MLCLDTKLIFIFVSFLLFSNLFGEDIVFNSGQITKENNLYKLHDPDILKVQFDVSLYTLKFSNKKYYEYSFWGSLATPPLKVIRSIFIYNQTGIIEVPPKAFDYLGNPSRFQIIKDNSRTGLRIFGGDGGASYIANLWFINGKIVERRIDSVEFSGDIYEVTKYVNKIENSNL